MLEYIKRQIAEKEKANQNVSQVVDPTDQLDSAILEYAHLVDELSDLTMEGHNALRERPILDIPIEDDVELDSIEMSITSGRIMDVPADITAMEHAYEDQKTFNDFFQEAYKNTGRLMRESDAHYSERVMNIADKEYHAYMEYVIQEGLFGNDMLSINDDRVPSTIMVDFGKYSGGNYITKIPVGFECDHNNRVNINQIHAVTISQNMRVFAHVAEFLANQIHTNQHINIRGSVWDVATPVMMIVPKFTGRYTTIVKFEIEGGTDEFVSWGIEESKIRKSKNEALDLNKIEGVEAPVEKYDTKKVSSMHLSFKDKNKPINEYVVPKKIPSRWDLYNDNTDYDYIQEAIDFGGGDNADTPPSGDNSGVNDAGAATNAGSNDTGMDSGNIDLGATDNANNDAAPTVDADAKSANVNDVSDAIAAKVSNETNKDSADLGMDAAPTFDSNPDVKLDLDSADAGSTDTSSEDVNNLEPDLSQDSSNDMGSTDNFNTQDVTGNDSTEPSSDEMKDELNGDFGDNTDVNSSDLGGGSMDNIDDMSIDDLLAKGEDKLKGMSIAQLKDFLNDGLGDEETATEYAIDNSFKKRLNVSARRCLGILNDSKKNINQIITEFHAESKKFNILLNQADKTNYFTESAKENLRKCNKSLVDLRMNLKQNPSNDDKKKIVMLIKEFANNSKNVVKMCEHDSAPVTMEYAMTCVTDDLGNIIQETVNTKIAKEILIWYLIGGVVKRDTPYGKFHFNKNFILQLLSPFTLGITGIIAVVKNIIHICRLIDNGLDEMISVELTNDIMTAYGLLTKTQDGVTMNAAFNKFKKALKKIVSDCKHASDCKNTDTRTKVANLGSKADVVLSEIKQNNQHVNEDSLKELVDAMEETLEVLVDKNKLKIEIGKLNKNKKN